MEADIFRKVYSQVSIRWGVWNSTVGGGGGGGWKTFRKLIVRGVGKIWKILQPGGGGIGISFFLSFFFNHKNYLL